MPEPENTNQMKRGRESNNAIDKVYRISPWTELRLKKSVHYYSYKDEKLLLIYPFQPISRSSAKNCPKHMIEWDQKEKNERRGRRWNQKAEEGSYESDTFKSIPNVELLQEHCCDYVEDNVNGGVDMIGNRREAAINEINEVCRIFPWTYQLF